MPDKSSVNKTVDKRDPQWINKKRGDKSGADTYISAPPVHARTKNMPIDYTLYNKFCVKKNRGKNPRDWEPIEYRKGLLQHLAPITTPGYANNPENDPARIAIEREHKKRKRAKMKKALVRLTGLICPVTNSTPQ